SLRLLALSLGSTKQSNGYFGATDSGDLSDKTFKSFEGTLGHFRFHNRSLSPIHVRIVYDEKKQNGSTSVSAPRTVSPLTRIDAQERKMLDQLAVRIIRRAAALHQAWVAVVQTPMGNLCQN
uniref:Uncharacterized protein n=1 Tax=Globisporangium ultimum (strain ATCC 200006 / CBS 805.95 / DAOM BR144) TaxID=431595 RepID=K3X670_GLOUD